MISPLSNDFLTIRSWLDAVVGGRDVVLRRTSALEYMQLFHGYVKEKKIDVYAKRRGEYENVNYCVVDSFDGIEYERFGDVLCATANQTFNEMIADYGNIDEQSLVEALAGYFFSQGESFAGLSIKPENRERFNLIRDWAVEYYDEA